MFVCICIWSFISIPWSINTWSAAIGAAKLTGNIAAGVLFFIVIQGLKNAEKKLVVSWLLAGFIFVLGMLFFEIGSGDPIYLALKGISSKVYGKPFWLNISILILAILAWPLWLAKFNKNVPKKLYKGTALFVIFTASSILILLLQIGFITGFLAFCAGMLCASLAWLFGRRAIVAATIIIVFVGLTLPLGFKYVKNPLPKIPNFITLPYSAQHRIKIWEFTANKIDQKRILGWGFNASKLMPDGNSMLYADTGQPYGKAIPLHPHNAILQLWLELGLPGIIFYLGLIIFIMIPITDRRRSKLESAIMFGQFSTIFVTANLSFGIWQAWWIAAIWLSAVLMVMVSKKQIT
jgi:O-antigen ligase